MSNAKHSSKSVLHYTPKLIVDLARETLGNILLDPASDDFGNQTVGAENFYAAQGLVRPWFGPLFVNPPGRSDDNPGGASTWWHKLIAEWEYGGRAWSAIFVGFSLEILQTCQSKGYRHPLTFPTCVPKRRIKFDVNAAALLESLPEGPLRAKVEAALKRGDTRYPGDSPTHGNFITCVARDSATAARFREAFWDIGAVT